jgi:hypothetical protein
MLHIFGQKADIAAPGAGLLPGVVAIGRHREPVDPFRLAVMVLVEILQYVPNSDQVFTDWIPCYRAAGARGISGNRNRPWWGPSICSRERHGASGGKG